MYDRQNTHTQTRHTKIMKDNKKKDNFHKFF